MEDMHTAQPASDMAAIPFFAVFDGHGGVDCAKFLQNTLHRHILSNSCVREDPERAIVEGCLAADEEFLSLDIAVESYSGSTAALVMIVRDSLVVGHVGDSEVVLCRGGQALPLTKPHNPSRNPDEGSRIEAAGGQLYHGRVKHPMFSAEVISLAVSRAIGDAAFKLRRFTDGKPSGIVATPDTCRIPLQQNDEFVVIGCDGLWDVMTPADVVALCREARSRNAKSQEIAQQLVQQALSLRTNDNVTVMYLSLQLEPAASRSRPQSSEGPPVR